MLVIYGESPKILSHLIDRGPQHELGYFSIYSFKNREKSLNDQTGELLISCNNRQNQGKNGSLKVKWQEIMETVHLSHGIKMTNYFGGVNDANEIC